MIRTFAVLGDPVFRRLWVGSSATGLATWAVPFILGLHLVAGGISPEQLGVLLAVRTAGFLLVMPLAGVIADLWSPARSVGLFGATAVVGTLLLAAGCWPGIGDMTAGLFVVAVVGAIFVGAGQGAVRGLSDPDRRQRRTSAAAGGQCGQHAVGSGCRGHRAGARGRRWSCSRRSGALGDHCGAVAAGGSQRCRQQAGVRSA